MKVQVARDRFAAMVAIAARISTGSSSLPVLRNVVIEARRSEDPQQESVLRLLASNLERHVILTLPAQVEENGAVCVPAKQLAEIVAALPEGNLSFSQADPAGPLLVSIRGSRYVLQGLPPEEMPSAPELAPDASAVPFTQKQLRRMIALVRYATSEDDTRPILTAVLLSLAGAENGQVLRFVATDTHRLALLALPMESSTPGEVSVLLPAETLDELSRMLRDTDDVVTVALDPNNGLFQTGGISLYTRLIDGVFPKYERIIPESAAQRWVLRRDELLTAMRRVRLVAREATAKNRVVLESDGIGTLLIRASAGDLGQATEELSLSEMATPMALAVNCEYLIDTLGAMDAELVYLDINAPLSPIVLGDPNDGTYRVIVMPMQEQ